MKKILSILLVLSMLLSASAALAEGMGVQVIGGPGVDTEPVSLDDVKLNVDVSIDGYGVFNFATCDFVNAIAGYKAGDNRLAGIVYDSGEDAEYVILRADITNLSLSTKDFTKNIEIKVVFDDTYEYGGWCFQYNYNYGTKYSYTEWPDGKNIGNTNPQNTVIPAEENFSIDPMYQGHYAFGCTLPNAIISSKAPLRMVITIDGNEITYNIRK